MHSICIHTVDEYFCHWRQIKGWQGKGKVRAREGEIMGKQACGQEIKGVMKIAIKGLQAREGSPSVLCYLLSDLQKTNQVCRGV